LKDFPENGKVVAARPFFHNFGLIMVMLSGIWYGWNLLLVSKFEPDEVMRIIKEEKPVMFAGVPTDYMALHGYPNIEEYGLDGILLYIAAGQSVPVDLLKSFEERTGRSIYEGYGLNEAGIVSFNTYLRGAVRGSVGVPVPGTDVRIVDEENREKDVAFGEPGELAVKGPQVMKGYWQMPEETADDLRDGWFYTGDIAQMDEEGYLYIVDRKKDVIVTGGSNVYPREVEEALYQRSEVVEAVAVGTPNEHKGAVVKVFVVKEQDSEVTEEELIEHCKENLAPYKVPKEIEFRDELPKSAVGKLLRRELAEEEGKEKEEHNGEAE
jgi:long-chain acyl-CoA synthetase